MRSFRSLLLACAIIIATLPSSALAQADPAPSAPDASADQSSTPWWEQLEFFGDFRVRFEGFYRPGDPTRQRGRFRLRAGLEAPVLADLRFRLRVASGDAADVTSTNQTLEGFWNRKPINIDQAALVYTPSGARALTLGAGKFGYPVARTQMVWDDDVNWEGAYEQLAWRPAGVSIRLVAVQSPLSEVRAGSDAFMFGEYAEAAFALGEHDLQLSIASYAFREIDQLALALDEGEAIHTQLTNAVRRDAAGNVVGYVSRYGLIDAIARVTADTGREGYPLAVTANYVVNTRAANGEDSGIWIEGAYGDAEAPGRYSVSYTVARIERDAVLSAFNFSDMGPATNVMMHMAGVSFMPRQRVNLDATAIWTKRLHVPAGAANRVLTRVQIDARVSF
jgi:hypothetical protein